MNTKAQETWPRIQQDYRAPFPDQDKRWLKWQGVLREHAWATLLSTRDRHQLANELSGATVRVIQGTRGDMMYRLYKGELRAKGDAVDFLFQIAKGGQISAA